MGPQVRSSVWEQDERARPGSQGRGWSLPCEGTWGAAWALGPGKQLEVRGGRSGQGARAAELPQALWSAAEPTALYMGQNPTRGSPPCSSPHPSTQPHQDGQLTRGAAPSAAAGIQVLLHFPYLQPLLLLLLLLCQSRPKGSFSQAAPAPAHRTLAVAPNCFPPTPSA